MPKPMSPETIALFKESCVVGCLHQEGVDRYKVIFGNKPENHVGVENVNPNLHAPSILGLIDNDLTQSWWTLTDTLDAIALHFLKAKSSDSPNITSTEVGSLMPVVALAYGKFPEHKVPKNVYRSFQQRLYKFRPKTNPENGPPSKMFGRGAIGEAASHSKDFQKKLNTKYKQDNPETIALSLGAVQARRAAAQKRGPEDPEYQKRLVQHKVSRVKSKIVAKIERVETEVELGGAESFLTLEELRVEKEVQMDLPRKELRGMSLRQAVDEKTLCKYIGITSVAPLEREAYSVLSRKTNNFKREDGTYDTTVNIPGVTFPNGKRLTTRSEKEDAGFFAFKVWENHAMFNCKRMEELIQEEFDHLPFGEILWRSTGAGSDYLSTFSKHCCVYMFASFDVTEHIKKGNLIYGNHKKTTDWDANNAGNGTL